MRTNQKPEWQTINIQGPEIKYYWHNYALLELDSEVLYQNVLTEMKAPWRVLIALRTLHKVIFDQLHSTVSAGHLGSKKTFAKIHQRFHWWRMSNDIEQLCRQCDACA